LRFRLAFENKDRAASQRKRGSRRM